jgi:excisionase family DNA binding protein
MTKRQAISKAQGMADYEDAVMVVIRQDGAYSIRAARDLDVQMTGPDWMARYGWTFAAVLPPTGSFSGMSASEILARQVARGPLRDVRDVLQRLDRPVLALEQIRSDAPQRDGPQGRAVPAGGVVTLIEAGALLSVTPDTLRQQIARGRLRATKRGRDWSVTPREVERYHHARRIRGKAGKP